MKSAKRFIVFILVLVTLIACNPTPEIVVVEVTSTPKPTDVSLPTRQNLLLLLHPFLSPLLIYRHSSSNLAIYPLATPLLNFATQLHKCTATFLPPKRLSINN